MQLALFIAALQSAGLAAPAAAPPDTMPVADSAALATAYPDAATRELVRLARGQRDVIDGSVFHYTATARQRISIGIRALRRERLLYRREVASRVEWWRDRPGRVEVQGAREAIPVALGGVRIPDELESWARDFVPRPGDDRLFVNPGGPGFAWHPLVEGGEALYRYAIGDTTVIRLPDGRRLRLVELRVTPRQRDFRVVTGSFWIELENHAVVQTVFRPAREFDLERDLPEIEPGADDDMDDVPGLLKPIRFDIRYITVEYGLWEMRWWMPRLMAFEGVVRMGAVKTPITLEIVYADYEVEADRYGLTELPPLTFRLAGDPHGRAREYEPAMVVVVPDDTAALLTSPQLPASVFAQGETLISDAEIRELGERLGALPAPPWGVERPRFTPPWTLGRGLLRYNRVEGLSVAARVDWDLTRAQADLTGRIGLADLRPRLELGVDLPALDRSWRLAGYYRRLAGVDPAARPLALGNSLNALLFGRDDGMYLQASGAEIGVTPAPGGGRYAVRLYAERQGAVEKETDFSLRHAAGGDGFRPNIAATPADQLGLRVQVGIDRGRDPTGLRWSAALAATAETGSYTFVRPGLTLGAAAPLPGKLLVGLELAGGTTIPADTGQATVQALWLLGGPATLRGFHGGELAGRDYARARLELATEFPGARLALFSDAGWAGTLDAWDEAGVAVSAGVGGSFLDGLVRLDLARALRPVERWRLELYLDALF
ncbi:MAG: hypothetical protein ACLFRX_04495 [Gemmatimonadota bacterium]